MEGMRLAFNKNHLAYTHALMAVDGHVSVLRAVINDLVCQNITVKENGGVVGVDWERYYGQYNEYIKQQAEEAKTKDNPEGNVLVTPEEFDEVVFGGDYDGNREVPEEHRPTSEENPGDEQGDSGDDDSPRPESE